ncbi:hypothetical protein B296_00007095 [Ensete ventricosum]|uniref:Uncharacterized protein n=1 Tax=Ensete ventricosum TaxID=4639 RepID=A0A426YXZ0_ENSVE|nr:hypothetical protein B296_00007095 [Ensete ventricosum]
MAAPPRKCDTATEIDGGGVVESEEIPYISFLSSSTVFAGTRPPLPSVSGGRWGSTQSSPLFSCDSIADACLRFGRTAPKQPRWRRALHCLRSVVGHAISAIGRWAL